MKRVLRILIVVDFLLLITSILVGYYSLMHIGVNEVLIKQMEEIHDNSKIFSLYLCDSLYY